MKTPIKSIRLKCIDCCCGSPKEVELCPASECPLFPYRFGKRPSTPRKGGQSKINKGIAPVFLADEGEDREMSG